MPGVPLPNESALLQRAKGGDVVARDKIALHYLEAAKLACRHHARLKGLDRADADSEAFPTLLQAIASYDSSRGASFATWIAKCAKGTITDVDREFDRQGQARHGKLAALPPGFRLPAHEDPPITRADEERRHERSVAEKIESLRGSYFRKWLTQRKGVDPVDQKIARMLWVPELVEIDAPGYSDWLKAASAITAVQRTLSQAEIAAKLKLSPATVSERRAAIILKLTGKTEDELLSS
jgi:RNA polymerase sigma factor (sigma-70 family)